MAMVMAILCDAARRTENAVERLGSSFRCYVVNLWNDNLLNTRGVTRAWRSKHDLPIARIPNYRRRESV